MLEELSFDHPDWKNIKATAEESDPNSVLFRPIMDNMDNNGYSLKNEIVKCENCLNYFKEKLKECKNEKKKLVSNFKFLLIVLK